MLSEKKNCCDQETVCLLNCQNPEYKKERSLGCLEVVNEFYKDSEKSQVNCLMTERRYGKWLN